ncbi:MAG TPA: response regulator transcription factor [Nitrospirae bacterium]|nr:response regulator transcription factor [Nitrospirota bacterium]
MPRTRIMIADDHVLVREGIRALLALHDDVEVVGEASDGKEAITMADKLRPDIVLMDISMPGLGGLEATVEIKKTNPDIKILVLSQYDDKEYVRRFLKAGVAGYILKKAVGEELITAIRAVARGEAYLYPSIASSVIDGYLVKDMPEVEDPFDRITDRELQVLKLIAEGLSHKEIASTLGISAKTVIAHQTNICEKLDIHTKAGLIKYAYKKSIVKPDS